MNIKKLLLMLMSLLVLTSCAKNVSDVKTDDVFYTFSDSTGKEIVLTEKPVNVAVLFSSYAEVWKLTGGEIAVTVGDSVKRGFAEDSAVLVNDGSGLKIDMEALVAAQPDFVIATADLEAQRDACEKMAELGVPCALFREENFRDYLYILKIFTEINGTENLYDEYGTQVGEEIEKLVENKSDFSYLFIRCGQAFSSTKAKTRDDHFGCVIIDELGGKNIADVAGDLASELSLESIVSQNPEYIFMVPQGDEKKANDYFRSLLAEDGWKELDAVKNGKIIYLPKDLFNYKPNHRWAQSYKFVLDSVN